MRFHEAVRKVPIAEEVAAYAVRLAAATRPGREGAADFVERVGQLGSRHARRTNVGARIEGSSTCLNGRCARQLGRHSCIGASNPAASRDLELQGGSRGSDDRRCDRSFVGIRPNFGELMATAVNLNTATRSEQAGLAEIDPLAVMRIKNLQLRAKAVVEGFYNGLHRSPFHGFSVEFSEYRPYTVGDDLRGLDWKLYARTDRYYIKKFEDETNRRCYLVLDQSKSMGFGSLEYSKVEYARTLVATLAYYLTLQRDSVGLMTFDEEIGEFISAHQRAGHFRQLLVSLSRPVAGQGTDLDQPLRQIAALVRRRGLIVLVSDMLAPITTLRTNLAYLRSRGHEVLILRTLDPSELELQLKSPSMVVDMETGREIYLDPDAARGTYREQFDAHQQELQSICDSLGVAFHQINTDQPLEQALFHLVSAQQRRSSGTARAGMLASSGRTGSIGSGGRAT